MYELTERNYVAEITKKKRIILTDTNYSGMKHYNVWLKYGEYKKTAHYTIRLNGEICKHFDSSFYSEMFTDSSFNKESIIIAMENEGCLTISEKNEFINWFGDIYDRAHVITKKWRNQEYWAAYSDEQYKTLKNLLLELCERHNIIDNLDSNVLKRNVSRGIFTKSNIERGFLDIHPGFDFNKLKNEEQD